MRSQVTADPGASSSVVLTSPMGTLPYRTTQTTFLASVCQIHIVFKYQKIKFIHRLNLILPTELRNFTRDWKKALSLTNHSIT